MFHYTCVRQDELPEISRNGLVSTNTRPVVLSPDLKKIRQSCDHAILVIDDAAVPAGSDTRSISSFDLPRSLILNIDPYAPPVPVKAGGGLIVRYNGSEPEILLIHRRGVWDLPKGKKKGHESLEECALREVKEETGASVRIVRDLGVTVHGYRENGFFYVKTTRWYLMETPDVSFIPETREGIDAVEWVTWDEAPDVILFPSYHCLFREVDSSIRSFIAIKQVCP